MGDPYKKTLQLGHDHAAKYLQGIDKQDVFPKLEAVKALDVFDEALPDAGASDAETLDMLARFGGPATTATMGGRYFGFVVGGALPATVAANWIATAWDQSPSSDINSPIGVKLEQVSGRWILDLFNLPADCGVGMTTGATMANFTALAAARTAILARAGWNVEADGLFGAPEIKVIVSDEVHVTVEKGLAMLGLGKARVTRVPTNENGAMLLAEVPDLDAMTLICTQAGNVNSGAIDPIGDIAKKAAKTRAWVHVDGAFGLWGKASRQHCDMLLGAEQANSFATDAHKWLNTPYDCGIVMCRDASALHSAMATTAPYFRSDSLNAPKDMVPEFSRRARGVEVWAALKTLGKQGLEDMIVRCCDHAKLFEAGLKDIGFTILNEVVLNQVVATIGTAEQLTAIRKHVERSGECWFGPTVWKGKPAIRISVSSWQTNVADVRQSLAAIRAAKLAVTGA
jgi:glutamate/tyrosine decarboxylase-like PLP-dependent enzyme